MNAIFAMVSGSESLESIASLLHQKSLHVDETSDGRLRASDGTDHVWIFLERDLDEVPTSLRDRQRASSADQHHTILVIEYYSLPFLNRILTILLNRPDAVIDNDHGTILSGSDFVAKTRAEPEWDWRKH